MLKENTSDLKVIKQKNQNDNPSLIMNLEQPDLITAIESKMTELGLNATQLAATISFSKSKVSEVLNRKRPLSKKMAKALYGLGIPASVLFKALIED